MVLVEAVIIGIAAWRIAALLSYERGPFNVFVNMREKLGIGHDVDGVPMTWVDSFIPNVLACVWCLGLYAAAAMWAVWQLSQAAVVVIAASSVLIAVEKWNRG